MREAFLFGAMGMLRERVLELADKCAPQHRTVQPPGFNNNILWHLGHILTVTDGIMYGLSGEASQLPASYRTFFGNGTKPSDWGDGVPSWETIIEQLKGQPQQIIAHFTGRLHQAAKENFANAETAGELLQVNLMHEHNHAGSINAMLKVLNS
ncbi:DinB family protein [Paenibacillus xerothermodurans]|nr:DinB family protein [Paenibacillus xerothermodurans]